MLCIQCVGVHLKTSPWFVAQPTRAGLDRTGPAINQGEVMNLQPWFVVTFQDKVADKDAEGADGEVCVAEEQVWVFWVDLYQIIA